MAANEAVFRHGNPIMADYTPSGADLPGGEVVVQGDTVMIPHRDIDDGDLGACAVGGGVYEVTADGALSAGVKVYWDDTANKVTATSTGNKVMGYLTDDTSAAADGDLVNVRHVPEAT